MEEHGFSRLGEQCKTKFKREKLLFFSLLEEWGANPPRKARGPHYKFLRELWEQAGRPHWSRRRPGTCGRGRAIKRETRRGNVIQSSSDSDLTEVEVVSDGEARNVRPGSDDAPTSSGVTGAISDRDQQSSSTEESGQQCRSIAALIEENRTLKQRLEEVEKKLESQDKKVNNIGTLVNLHQAGILKVKRIIDSVRRNVKGQPLDPAAPNVLEDDAVNSVD